MQINSRVFLASAQIYQAIIESPQNRVPYDIQYAVQARNLAEGLFNACNRDPVMTAAAAHCLCGFMKNPMSAHCSEYEFIQYGLMGARYLVQAFNQNTKPTQAPLVSQPPFPQQQVATSLGQLQPPQFPSQPVVNPPAFVMPDAPMDVPDFTTGQ